MTTHHVTQVRINGIGNLWIARTAKGLCRIEFAGSRRALQEALPKDACIEEGAQPFRRLIDQLQKYASGREVRFDEGLDLGGTAFQRAVWRAIAAIPWGETRSYAWLARKAGRPTAVRAAASACGANPLPIVTPCHRVIASDGTLGGFSGGLALKKKLLAIEGRQLVS